MLTRYKKTITGKLIKQADIYLKAEHGLKRASFDADAIAICKRLQEAGYEAYIVGGAVRDLLFGSTPKDFDITTSAYPNKVHKLFRHARVIGKRFKLVHVVTQGQKVFEVATFRSLSCNSEDTNIYGTLDDDAWRRDFTLNALYYDPVSEKIIDFHGGIKDIKNRVIMPVIPLNRSFQEDPVRMIRAVKCAVLTDSVLPTKLKHAIKKYSPLLKTCSQSRLSEELLKILQGSMARAMFQKFLELNLLVNFLPNLNNYLKSSTTEQQKFFDDLTKLEQKAKKNRGDMFYLLLNGYLDHYIKITKDNSSDVFNLAKEALLPIVVANRDLVEAIEIIYATKGIKLKSNYLAEKKASTGRRRPSRALQRNKVKKVDPLPN